MSRPAPLDPDAAHAAAAAIGIPDYVADINVFRVLLRHPPIAKCLNDMLQPLLLEGTIDARRRELVIMRVGWVTGSEYEWGQHWTLGPAFGAPVEDLAAVRDWETDARFDATDRAILAATDELLAGGPVTDATWRELTSGLPESQCIELLMLVGGYQALSGVLRSLEVPLDDGLEVWPPAGRP
jgi:alkylhydroperoxidase family enzyme